MKRAFFLVAAIATLTALPLAAQASPSATPTKVSCGQTLTKSTTLANDLVDCRGTGLIIGVANITVDLNGHTIDGTNHKEGISNQKRANVTIVNGTISDFHSAGVNVFGARGLVLRKLTVRKIGAGCRQTDICAGLFLMNSPRATITDNDVSNQVQAFQVNGIDVYASPGGRVKRNRFDRNSGQGIAVFQSPGTRVIGNELDGNKQIGLHANADSDSILISDNRARGNRNAGLAVGAMRGATVVGNVVSGNGEAGLLLFDIRDSLIRRNRASGNFNGIVLYGGQAGVAQYGGRHGARHNQLAGNKATKNTRVGILVRGDSRTEASDNNALSGNVANGNGRAGGMVVEGSARGNRLRGNTANANAGHGITAARGTIDGGGNRAHRNRRSPQCVGVRCS